MEYWAAGSGSTFLNSLNGKVESYDRYLESSGKIEELRDSYQSFYGDSALREGGQQGELTEIRINHYSSLIRNLVALVTNSKPAWQPIASNSDLKSQSAAILATGLLDHYMKSERLDREFRKATTQACFLREAWMSVTWDVTLGEFVAVNPETGTPVNEGDLSFNSFTIQDVIRDTTLRDSKYGWLITREYKNRFDLAAQFPEHSQEILAMKSDGESSYRRTLNYTDTNRDLFGRQESDDLIPVYTFYHKKTAAVPNGRLTQFINSSILTDSPLPYDRIPLFRLAAEDMIETGLGHSPMLDVLPLQKAIDIMATTLLSNNRTFGVQNIVAEKGSGVEVKRLGTGMNLIEIAKGSQPPQPLQLTASAPESYRLFDMLVQQSQLLSGVNDAVRGQASAGQSGASLALLSQQAIQFANGLQQSYTSLVEDVGTMAVSILQRYANTKRVAILSGKANRSILKEWSSEDLQGVSRITIESGNALSKTASGRLTIADSLMQAGMVQNPEQYLQVLQTGNLSPLLENQTSQLMLIRQENEDLSDGKSVRALLTDNHSEHILEHAVVLNSPMARANPDSPVVQNALAHIMEHLELAKGMTPELAAMLKQQSFFQAPAPQPQAIPPVMNGENSITTEAGEVNQPNMPVNPLTNEPFNPNEQ